MEDLSLHILDVVENSIRAGADEVKVILDENKSANTLTVFIKDNGCGMDEDAVKNVGDPFFSTKEGKNFGFGISLLAQAAENTEGYLTINSVPGQGTDICALFHSDHIDMKPLGDMELTMDVLKMSHREINFIYEFVRGGNYEA
ncbi:MAG: ATP-binding protein [Spirochaetaceae bacterium]|jgi:signal transduction histidine kinase|nr:ATP-binding protein [Spirochaetaceae bacterium]